MSASPRRIDASDLYYRREAPNPYRPWDGLPACGTVPAAPGTDLRMLLRYLDADGRPAVLRFDVNFLDRVQVLPVERLPVRHPLGDEVAPTDVQTLALPELAAGKTIALVRRALARDLFDVAMLSALPALDEQLLRTVLVVRGAGYSAPSPADYSAKVIDRVRPARWRSEVLALARRPVPLSLDTAKERAAEFLGRVTEFSDGHREFLRRLDLGELRPDLLPERELVDRVAVNCALLWRLRVGAEALEER